MSTAGPLLRHRFETLADASAALAEAVAGLPAGSAGLPLGDLLEAAAPAVAAAERFFEDILVNAEDESVRAARQGLLASLLAAAPADVDWRALDIALG